MEICASAYKLFPGIRRPLCQGLRFTLGQEMLVTITLDLDKEEDKETFTDIPRIWRYKAALSDISNYFRMKYKNGEETLDVEATREAVWDIIADYGISEDA